MTWEVFEVERSAMPKAVRPVLGDGWLCFQRPGHRVRLAKGRYPETWSSLSDLELEGLMGQGLVSNDERSASEVLEALKASRNKTA